MKVFYVGLAALGTTLALGGCVPEPGGYGGYGGYGYGGVSSGPYYGGPAYVEPGYRGGYGPGPVVVVPGRDRYEPPRYDRQRVEQRYDRDRRGDDNRRGPPSAPPQRYAAPPPRPSAPPPPRNFGGPSAPGPATEPGAGHPSGPN